MAHSSNVTAQLEETIRIANRSLDTQSSQAYEVLDLDLRKLEALAREAFQVKINELIWPVLEKLEKGETLTTTEQEMVEMVVVGEAKYYVKSENDVDIWQNEIRRLVEEIQQFLTVGVEDVDNLMRLRALCSEAMRVVPDLAFYLREQERVSKFKAAMAGAIDVDTRRLLASLIKDMISSDKV